MDLAEAIKEAERRSVVGALGAIISNPEWFTILEAAKAELARREGEGTVRIRNAEGVCRDVAALMSDPPRKALLDRAADILKALRETVVPWLRNYSERIYCEHDAVLNGKEFLAMLRALGEFP